MSAFAYSVELFLRYIYVVKIFVNVERENMSAESNEAIARKATSWLMNPVDIKYGESPTPEADAYLARAEAMRNKVKQLLDVKDADHIAYMSEMVTSKDAEISRLKTEVEKSDLSFGEACHKVLSLTSKLEIAKKAIKALKARHDLFTDGRTTHEVVDESLCPDCIVDDLASQALLEIERET